MFKRTTRYSLLVLGIITLIWGVSIFYVRPGDITKIKKRLHESEHVSKNSLMTTTQQQRTDVVKEIWFTQEDNSRLNYRIFSETSLLTIQPTGKKFELIENLRMIKCWMQDKLYPPTAHAGPTQQVRFFAAKEGTYRFTSQEFLAQSVSLSLYRLGGHELPREIIASKPFLKGVAQDVSFAVSGNNPQFTAKHFKAELNTYEEKKR